MCPILKIPQVILKCKTSYMVLKMFFSCPWWWWWLLLYFPRSENMNTKCRWPHPGLCSSWEADCLGRGCYSVFLNGKFLFMFFFFFCCSHTADSSSLRTDSNHSWSCHPHLTQPSSAPSEQQIIFWAPVKAGSTIHTSLLQWVPLYLCISIIIWFLQAWGIACRQRKVWDENSEKINSIV